MEDLDRPRVVPGADRDMLDTLERYGLTWDGEVVYQSQRIPLYDEALETLRRKNLIFDCACSRAELQRAVAEGRLGMASPQMLYALGKMMLAGYLAGVSTPEFEEALIIVKQG